MNTQSLNPLLPNPSERRLSVFLSAAFGVAHGLPNDMEGRLMRLAAREPLDPVKRDSGC